MCTVTAVCCQHAQCHTLCHHCGNCCRTIPRGVKHAAHWPHTAQRTALYCHTATHTMSCTVPYVFTAHGLLRLGCPVLPRTVPYATRTKLRTLTVCLHRPWSERVVCVTVTARLRIRSPGQGQPRACTHHQCHGAKERSVCTGYVVVLTTAFTACLGGYISCITAKSAVCIRDSLG